MRTIRLSKKNIYQISIWVLLVISVLALAYLAPYLYKPAYLPADDFFHFWAGGYQNLHGKNPFDPAAIELLRVKQGFLPNSAWIPIVLNPPWVVALLMPLGLLNYPLSRVIWLLLSTTFILTSAVILWGIYSGTPKQRWLIILVAFIFAPTISVLEKGQNTPLVLLGLSGFLYFATARRNDWMAGICLYMVTIKPQVMVLFWLALLFWVIQQRRWRILISAGITIFISTSVAMIFNMQLLQQYLVMLRTYRISDLATPTIGAYLRFFWLGVDKFWLQFIPPLIGVCWFIYYWVKNKAAWSWLDKLPLLLLVSLVTAPYTYTYDQVILLPAIVLAVVWLVRGWKSRTVIILAIIFIVLSALDLLLHMKLDDFWFIWMAPALFAWFLAAQYYDQKSQKHLKLTSVPGIVQ